MALAHIGAGDDHLCAQRLGVQDLLAAHLVRHHEERAIALAGPHQSQTDAGITGRRLDDGAARLQAPVSFRSFDHGPSRTVLYGTAGIGALQLEEKLAGTGIETRHLDERGPSDQVQGSTGSHFASFLCRIDYLFLFYVKQNFTYKS
jgi:hypothetical protein